MLNRVVKLGRDTFYFRVLGGGKKMFLRKETFDKFIEANNIVCFQNCNYYFQNFGKCKTIFKLFRALYIYVTLTEIFNFTFLKSNLC